ncbi:dienelactone hydrolase family protein [Lewinella cohaerens]|uniref:dienelactone hydrolase family protein n=1 Tax=Lewinella cohaerens TaxID=70995 RepID=UPI00037F7706|nr:dienelactone hydrolase family protein [Lewinella cohaerens]
MKIFYILFLTGTLFLLTACGGENAATDTEETSTEETAIAPKIMGEEVTYKTDTTAMVGYIAYDENASEKRPGILVVHEWWGHNDYVRERARMLAELGYVALAVDMYGDGKQADHPDDAGKFAMSVMSNFPTAEARFNAALEVLKDHPKVASEDIGAIGYCFGGGVVLSMANTGADIDAVASFHGSLGLPVMPEKGKTTAKVLVLNGADDPFVTAEQIAAYAAAMEKAEADYKFINYEGAVHAFTSEGADAHGEKFDLPLAYNKEADEASWKEMKALFSEVFKK